MDLRPRMKLSNTESMTTLVGENAPRSAVTASLNSEDKKEHTPQQEDPLEELTSHERYLASPFTKQNVALVFGNSKLYVQKELLIAVSPVFKAMFSSSILEGSKEEIPLPGKQLSHFVLFLRYLAPGFDDEFSGDTVHDMLSLADEYQTDDLKKRIEKFLVKGALTKSDSITSEQIIIDILEAEMFKLSDYLNASIAVASRKKFNSLTKSPKFEEISLTTQRRISFKRWEDIDEIFNKAVKVSHRFKQYYEDIHIGFGFRSAPPEQYEIDIKDVGEHLKPYMKEN
ncbi:BTB and MATH domain-containing protein 38-like [Mytilus edulis]|uniref:BTB and MATH domain-containing protein 38-like n=1 Tax=Mytilus edulis TaxID=6550 RepID=UPI0039EFE5D7